MTARRRTVRVDDVVNALVASSLAARLLAEGTPGREVYALKWVGLVSYLRESGLLPVAPADLDRVFTELENTHPLPPAATTPAAMKETDA